MKAFEKSREVETAILIDLLFSDIGSITGNTNIPQSNNEESNLTLLLGNGNMSPEEEAAKVRKKVVVEAKPAVDLRESLYGNRYPVFC